MISTGIEFSRTTGLGQNLNLRRISHDLRWEYGSIRETLRLQHGQQAAPYHRPLMHPIMHSSISPSGSIHQYSLQRLENIDMTPSFQASIQYFCLSGRGSGRKGYTGRRSPEATAPRSPRACGRNAACLRP
jgi:hypothetical protein